jgi:hypothetical protein
VNRSEAIALGLWRVRLDRTRMRCLAVAESSPAAAERLGRINRACQQKDARIYLERGRDALLAVGSYPPLTTVCAAYPAPPFLPLFHPEIELTSW